MADDFLSRWSRRKRGSEPEPEPDAPADPPNATPAPQVEAAEDETEAELLARLGLKHPDEMTRGDDFAAFLRSEVPRHLRTLALRRLWRSDPTFACLDGLNDYDGDFTGGGVPAGTLRTAYEVGRGLLRKVADAAAEGAGDPEPPPAGVEEAPADETVDVADGTGEPAMEAEPAPEPQAPRATRRRMVFKPQDSQRTG
jgi:hypothetical protein